MRSALNIEHQTSILQAFKSATTASATNVLNTIPILAFLILCVSSFHLVISHCGPNVCRSIIIHCHYFVSCRSDISLQKDGTIDSHNVIKGFLSSFIPDCSACLTTVLYCNTWQGTPYSSDTYSLGQLIMRKNISSRVRFFIESYHTAVSCAPQLRWIFRFLCHARFCFAWGVIKSMTYFNKTYNSWY